MAKPGNSILVVDSLTCGTVGFLIPAGDLGCCFAQLSTSRLPFGWVSGSGACYVDHPTAGRATGDRVFNYRRFGGSGHGLQHRAVSSLVECSSFRMEHWNRLFWAIALNRSDAR